jgi:hypothetical protein
MINSELRRILDIVEDLSQRDVKKDVLEIEIISHSGLRFAGKGSFEWIRVVAFS